ncbi:short chain dehydrogenase domain protein [Mycobacterium xenopi 3993]|nr:short chain dehydrogenase domain protein [Mycobacterium xenopi 3993]
MKSVFITGAGSGMGREGAKVFHARGGGSARSTVTRRALPR